MYKIINRHVYEIASGENITLCDIVADTSTDLPDADDQALYKIAFGSFAYVIDEGVFYSLDSSGTWNGGSYSEVVDEVITARGSFSSLDARLDDMDVILNSAKLGVKYKGAVNYYNDLPSTGNEIGDAYTVKYSGSSGTTPDGTEYVWGELSGVEQWIDFSKDCYTKSEINTMLAGKVNVEAGKGLSSNDFTDADKSQIETNKNNISTDEAALVELVDGGAKNLADMSKSTFTSTQKDGVTVTLSGDNMVSSGNSGTGTNNFFNVYYKSTSDVLIPSGTWVAALIGTGIENFRIEIYDSTKIDLIKGNFGEPVTFTLGEGATGSYARITNKPSTNCTGSFKLLICSPAAWDISQAYQPYRPSYQELYDRILALENNP